MPRLKDITCTVEYANSNIAFKEYGTTYGDGFVETYIAVPDHPQEFLIHLKSRGFIASGLAMLVYIDGNYHTNRNRINLRPAKPREDVRHTEVEFRVRQKEIKSDNPDLFYGRQWQFDQCNFVAMDSVPGDARYSDFHHLGEIEVLVLRCTSPQATKIDSDSDSFTDRDGDDLDLLDLRDSPETVAVDKTSKPRKTSYQPPTATAAPTDEEDDGGGLFSLFDGAADVPRRVKFFGLDGSSDDNGQENRSRKSKSSANPNQQSSQAQPMMNPYGWPMPMSMPPWTAPYPNPWMMGYPMMPPFMPPQNMAGVPTGASAPNGGATGPYPQGFFPQGQGLPAMNGWPMGGGPGIPPAQFQGSPNWQTGVPPAQSQPPWSGGPAPAVFVNVAQPTGWGTGQSANAPGGGWANQQSPGQRSKSGDKSNQGEEENQQDNDNNDNGSQNGENNENKDEEWVNPYGDTNQADNNSNKNDDDNNNNDNNNSWDKPEENNWNKPEENNWNNAQNNDNSANNQAWNTTPANDNNNGQQDNNEAAPQQFDGHQSQPLRGPFGIYHQAPRTSRSAIEEEPIYDVPQIFADHGQTHQCRAGSGHLYSHKKITPKYLDTVEEPYARFVFKYRRPDVIQRVTGYTVEETTAEESLEKAQSTLAEMSREELLAYAQGLQVQLGQQPDIPIEIRRQVISPRQVYQQPPPAPRTNFLFGGEKLPQEALQGQGLGIDVTTNTPNQGNGNNISSQLQNFSFNNNPQPQPQRQPSWQQQQQQSHAPIGGGAYGPSVRAASQTYHPPNNNFQRPMGAGTPAASMGGGGVGSGQVGNWDSGAGGGGGGGSGQVGDWDKPAGGGDVKCGWSSLDG